MSTPAHRLAPKLRHIGVVCCFSLSIAACSFGSGAYASVPSDPVTQETGIPVPLPDGRIGHFFAAICEGLCSESTVRWEEDGVVRSVGEDVGTGGRVLELAWQAIDPTADAPVEPVACGAETIPDGDREAAVISDRTTGLHWVSVCSPEGTFSTLAPGPGVLSWVEIDGDDSNDIELEVAGRSWLFTVTEDNRVFPLWATAQQ